MTSGKSEGNKELISKQQALRIYWPIGMSLSDIKDRTKYYKSIDEALNKYVLQIMNPGTSVKIEWMKKTGLFYHFPYLAMITNVYMINDILEAESQGYAAAMVGPHYDPGLLAAREAAQIPVTGPGESAMMIAQTLGRRFAVLTVREGFVPMIEQNIRVYGYESRVITRRPVRCFSMTFDNLALCMEGKSDEWLVEFEKTARECIADGADVIVAGGQFFGPIFLRHKFFTIPNTGVPVVDCAACGLKLAEMLASLRQTIRLNKSEHMHSPFLTQPKDILDKVRREFNLIK